MNPALYGVLESQWRTDVPMSVSLGTKRVSKSDGGWEEIRPGRLWMWMPCGQLPIILIASKYSWGQSP